MAPYWNRCVRKLAFIWSIKLDIALCLHFILLNGVFVHTSMLQNEIICRSEKKRPSESLEMRLKIRILH